MKPSDELEPSTPSLPWRFKGGTGVHEEQQTLDWNNAVLVHSDDEIVRFVNELKSQSGGDIHLAGGARLAQTFVRLGLVDRYRFVVYPVVSPGAQWFDQIADQRPMKLIEARPRCCSTSCRRGGSPPRSMTSRR